jgi:Spy/CpxP family protein refolding chaperone
MSNKQRSIGLLIATALATSLGTGPLSAQAAPATAPAKPAGQAAPSNGPPTCSQHPAIAALGNLDVEQRQKLDSLRSKKAAELAPVRQELARKYAELASLWAADAPERARILQKHGEISALRTKIQTASVDYRLAVLALLRTEQRAALRAQGMPHGPQHGGAGHGAATPGPGKQPGGMGHGGPMHGMMMQGGMHDCMSQELEPYDCAAGLRCGQ